MEKETGTEIEEGQRGMAGVAGVGGGGEEARRQEGTGPCGGAGRSLYETGWGDRLARAFLELIISHLPAPQQMTGLGCLYWNFNP